MDYIREELLRQQALLAILLTGQRPEREDFLQQPERPPWDRPRENAGTPRSVPAALAADPWETWDGAGAPAWTAGVAPAAAYAAAARQGTAAWDKTPAGRNGGRSGLIPVPAAFAWNIPAEAAGTGAAVPTAAEQRRQRTLAAAVRDDGTPGGRERTEGARTRPAGGNGGSIPPRRRAAAGSAPAEAGEIRLVTELQQTTAAEHTDPAALSRAFERDARRYDGGFRLY